MQHGYFGRKKGTECFEIMKLRTHSPCFKTSSHNFLCAGPFGASLSAKNCFTGYTQTHSLWGAVEEEEKPRVTTGISALLGDCTAQKQRIAQRDPLCVWISTFCCSSVKCCWLGYLYEGKLNLSFLVLSHIADTNCSYKTRTYKHILFLKKALPTYVGTWKGAKNSIPVKSWGCI